MAFYVPNSFNYLSVTFLFISLSRSKLDGFLNCACEWVGEEQMCVCFYPTLLRAKATRTNITVLKISSCDTCFTYKSLLYLYMCLSMLTPLFITWIQLLVETCSVSQLSSSIPLWYNNCPIYLLSNIFRSISASTSPSISTLDLNIFLTFELYVMCSSDCVVSQVGSLHDLEFLF